MAYDGQPNYALIECFIALENKIIAVLLIVSHTISTIPGITHIIPVAIESEMDCCLAKDILFKFSSTLAQKGLLQNFINNV